MTLAMSGSVAAKSAKRRHHGHQLPPTWQMTNLGCWLLLAVASARSICSIGLMVSSYTFFSGVWAWPTTMEAQTKRREKISLFIS